VCGKVLRRQTDNLRRMVEDLLDVARVTQGKIDPKWEMVDLGALLQRVTDSARRSLTDPRKQTLRVHVPRERLEIRGDSLRLEQVFANLLDNASKYSDAGASVDVQLDTEESADGGAKLATVSIEDTGIGIRPEALEEVFNLFSQADVPLSRSRGGLGIGLTLVRTLVQLHGGSVAAASEGVGKGTRVEVRLPVWMGAELLAGDLDDSHEADVFRRKVLIVEDNPDGRETLRLLLEDWGHDVLIAADGAEGVRTIADQKPDVALVDIGLPVLNGYELARQVRKRDGDKQLLLVALTGYGASDQRARAIEAGFDAYMVKPVDAQQLARLISSGPATAPAPAGPTS
jgi:CheY-like chemotaxis protein